MNLLFRFVTCVLFAAVQVCDSFCFSSFPSALHFKSNLCSTALLHSNQKQQHHRQLLALLGKSGHAGKIVGNTEYIKLLEDGSDAWRCQKVVQILKSGGLGVLPTDTSYCFATSITSKDGLERLLTIKGLQSCKKPLSMVVHDLSTIDRFSYGIDRQVFKILKKNLPGPYTFILPASSSLPKMMFLNGKGSKKNWKRETLGVRMPDDPVLQFLLEQLDEPLLVSSVPTGGDDHQLDPHSKWWNAVDFIVHSGMRPQDGSTIFDLTGIEPILIREGIGAIELSF